MIRPKKFSLLRDIVPSEVPNGDRSFSHRSITDICATDHHIDRQHRYFYDI